MKQYMPSIDHTDLSEHRTSVLKDMRKGKLQSFPAPLTRPIDRPYYVPETDEDQTLVFESRFESGNLNLAAKLNDGEYNLIL